MAINEVETQSRLANLQSHSRLRLKQTEKNFSKFTSSSRKPRAERHAELLTEKSLNPATFWQFV